MENKKEKPWIWLQRLAHFSAVLNAVNLAIHCSYNDIFVQIYKIFVDF